MSNLDDDHSSSDEKHYRKTSNEKPRQPNPQAIAEKETKSRNNNVDRLKTCPFLSQVYVSQGDFLKEEDFIEKRPGNAIAIHSWSDTSLRELFNFISLAHPDILEKECKLVFRSIFHLPLLNRRYQAKDLGVVFSSKNTRDDERTLGKLNFRIGDIINVAILDESAAIPFSRSSVRRQPLDDQRRKRSRQN